MKVLIVDLMDRLEVGFSVGTTCKPCCDEEMAKASEKKNDLEAGDAKDQPKFEPAVANWNTMDGRTRESSPLTRDRFSFQRQQATGIHWECFCDCRCSPKFTHVRLGLALPSLV